MAFDTGLAERVRRALRGNRAIAEKLMFGGIAFLCRGHMCCGIVNDKLMIRLAADVIAGKLREPHVKPMDFTGKPMKTMCFVEAPGLRDDSALRRWVGMAVAHAESLPAKSGATKKKPAAKRRVPGKTKSRRVSF